MRIHKLQLKLESGYSKTAVNGRSTSYFFQSSMTYNWVGHGMVGATWRWRFRRCWRTMEPDSESNRDPGSWRPVLKASIFTICPMIASPLPSHTHRLFGLFFDKPIPHGRVISFTCYVIFSLLKYSSHNWLPIGLILKGMLTKGSITYGFLCNWKYER
jgi:hypothetical protein